MTKEERNRLRHFEAQIAARKGTAKASNTRRTGVLYRETPQYRSVTSTGSTERVERPQYTGDKLLGIGVLHKSNLVPIFNESDAHDITRMRR